MSGMGIINVVQAPLLVHINQLQTIEFETGYPSYKERIEQQDEGSSLLWDIKAICNIL